MNLFYLTLAAQRLPCPSSPNGRDVEQKVQYPASDNTCGSGNKHVCALRKQHERHQAIQDRPRQTNPSVSERSRQEPSTRLKRP
jgi:hypothetical protein